MNGMITTGLGLVAMEKLLVNKFTFIFESSGGSQKILYHYFRQVMKDFPFVTIHHSYTKKIENWDGFWCSWSVIPINLIWWSLLLQFNFDKIKKMKSTFFFKGSEKYHKKIKSSKMEWKKKWIRKPYTIKEKKKRSTFWWQ